MEKEENKMEEKKMILPHV